MSELARLLTSDVSESTNAPNAPAAGKLASAVLFQHAKQPADHTSAAHSPDGE
ncbi:hypothetical protein AMD24_00234 [Candidatus Xiphinematobacter sp. Idaho Grape]|nr:hypothetical protein AMD24_00234 [Candidatus Xiphinematobacter sp. Idaho Grape]